MVKPLYGRVVGVDEVSERLISCTGVSVGSEVSVLPCAHRFIIGVSSRGLLRGATVLSFYDSNET